MGSFRNSRENQKGNLRPWYNIPNFIQVQTYGNKKGTKERRKKALFPICNGNRTYPKAQKGLGLKVMALIFLNCLLTH